MNKHTAKHKKDTKRLNHSFLKMTGAIKSFLNIARSVGSPVRSITTSTYEDGSHYKTGLRNRRVKK